MDKITRQLHQQLASGERLAIGWGVSGYVNYQLRFSPYPFQYLVDGSRKMTGQTIDDVPVISPEQLAILDSERYVVVVLAEWSRFGAEITAQAHMLGFCAVPPAVASELADEFPVMSFQTLIEQFTQSHPAVSRQKQVAVLYIHSLVKGGAERQIVLLAQGLAELGYQVHLICQSPDHPTTLGWQQELLQAGIQRHVFPKPQQLWTEQPPSHKELRVLREFSPFLRVRGLHNIISMKRLLETTAPELFVSYLDDCNLSSAVAGIWSKQHSTLLSCRNLQPDTDDYANLNDFYIVPASALRHWYSQLSKSSRIKIYHNSFEGKLSYERWIGEKTSQVVIENAISNNLSTEKLCIRSKYKLPIKSKIVVAAMRLSQEKNPLGFIKLIKNMRDQQLNVIGILIGDGPLMAEAVNLRSALGLEGSLFIIGFIDNVTSYLQDADLCVVPSFQEGSSNLILEALSVGCPVIAYAVGGIKSLMSSELSNYLVPPQRDDLLLEKCIKIIKTPNESEIFKSISSVFRSRYSINSLTKKTIALSSEIKNT